MSKKQKVYSAGYKFQTSATPTTNMAEMEWINELWAETSGDPRICIAVLDGPVVRSHASLATANLTNLDTLVAAGADQGPATKHGTHVASIIFGQHDGPVKGIAPSCRGLIVPIFKDGDGDSIAPCSQIDLARRLPRRFRPEHRSSISPSLDHVPFLEDPVAFNEIVLAFLADQ